MKTTIDTPEELVRKLDYGTGYDGYVGLLKRVRFNPESLDQYTFWSPVDHTRNCIAKRDSYELLLMCWEPGQQTPIHDYGNQQGWSIVLEGELTEERYFHSDHTGDTELVTTELRKPGALAYVNDSIGYHRFCNNSSGRTMSLHIYAHPLGKCTMWNPETKQTIAFTPHYTSFKGELTENAIPAERS